MVSKSNISIPASLEHQVGQYRRSVGRLKVGEGIGIAAAILFGGFLVVFILDRVWETPTWVRVATFLTVIAALSMVPLVWYRWVLRLKSNASVAQLLRRYHPSLGASLLGAIELAENSHEQSRSRTLCEAALVQVAESFQKKNLLEHLPFSRRTLWLGMASVAIALTLGVTALFPAASWNSWLRLFTPFGQIERYTFAKLSDLPKRLVVPYGEEYRLPLGLANDSQWRPPVGTLKVAGTIHKEPLDSSGQYPFQLPALRDLSLAEIRIGDSYSTMQVQPSMRPELEKLAAVIQLPEYLQISSPITRDIRSGKLSVLRGSTVSLTSQTTKPLASATVNGEPLQIENGTFQLKNVVAKAEQSFALNWSDTDGLQAKADFPLALQVYEDEAPIVFGEGLPRAQVLLETEQIQFLVRAADDFGIKHIGLEWRTIEDSEGATAIAVDNSTSPHSTSQHGEQGTYMLMQGSPDSTALEAQAVFQASSMQIPTKLVEVRLFAEDFNPERGRTYSPAYAVRILTPAEHSEWLIDQVEKWQRESLEVRDRELQLLAANRQLRSMSHEELATDQGRTRLEQQAALELNNGRRLASVNAKGEELLRLAAKNPDIDPNHLEQWAQMHQVLRDIADNRMPSVSDLLKKGANALAVAQKDSKATNGNKDEQEQASAPQVGNQQAGNQQNDQSSGESDSSTASKSQSPSITDQESSQTPSNDLANSESSSSPPKQGGASLSLPTTTLAGGAGSSKPKAPNESDEQETLAESADDIAEAVRQQEELLAEFEKVADRLNGVLANLEGSTLIKRLKAASRVQLDIAEQTSTEIGEAFGITEPRLKSEQRVRLQGLSYREQQAADQVATIVDDLKGFHERKPSPHFETVLAQMEEEAVYDSLRQLAHRILDHQGLAVAEAEYWSDTLDRWAEDILEDPSSGEGEAAEGKSSGALPPALILEVMQVLEQEMNLRERTRVAEQAKSATKPEDYAATIVELSTTQLELKERIADTRKKIRLLPDAESAFQNELGMLTEVDLVMFDAFTILKEPHTGERAIAAETEVIELLLKTQRASAQKTSGGGGTTSGGGGEGTTDAPALALIGAGINPLESRDTRSGTQATGTTGKGLPEEYRSGLDEYFEKIERSRSRP